MSNVPDSEFQAKWHRFLRELELAKHYPQPYRLYGFGRTARNPLLDYLLPTLLYVRMVSLLDEAMGLAMATRGLKLPRKAGNSLHAKIECLEEQQVLCRAQGLYAIKNNRNSLAHETDKAMTWDALDSDLAIVQSELQHLHLVGERPEYEFFYERSGLRVSDKPGILGDYDYSFGLRLDDEIVTLVSWTETIYRLDPSKAGFEH